MNGIGTIHRQNALVGLKELREKYIGKQVEANPTSDVETTVQGVVQDVLINNNRYEWQLAGKVGHFIHPKMIPNGDGVAATA